MRERVGEDRILWGDIIGWVSALTGGYQNVQHDSPPAPTSCTEARMFKSKKIFKERNTNKS